uniref:Mre11 DNA-binding domain-containing protein n=1 Tax=Romanomermis culicivorax TaxID=13658 RepID=A0A915J9N2_ROMCU
MELFCRQKVEDLLAQARSEHSGSSKQPKEPLIRLSVDLWLGFDDIFNVVRFGQQFLGRVANPKDLVLFHRHREQRARVGAGVDRELVDRVAAKALSSRVEDYVVKYFANVSDDKQMVVLTERGLAESLKHFVDKDEKDAIATLLQHQLARCKHRLK